MSDRPTPETDKLITDWIQGVTNELPNFVETARKLERERDEAREKYDNLATEHMLAINKICNERDEAIADLEFRRGLYKVLEGANNHLMTANQEVAKLARTLKQERDEARSELSLKQQTLTIAEGTLSDLRKQLEGTK